MHKFSIALIADNLCYPAHPYPAHPYPAHPPREGCVWYTRRCNANKKADVVDAAESMAFNACFDTAQRKLDAASLSAREQIAMLCQRLQEPILNAFTLQSKQSKEPRSMQGFKEQQQTLFAKSSVQRTDKNLDMRFSAWTLASDM